MARTSPIITNFTAGQLSPRLAGRVDLTRYPNGAKRLINFRVRLTGGAVFRGGTRYVGNQPSGATACRMIPFVYSTEQAYAIAAVPAKLWFYAAGGRLETSPGVPVEVVTPFAAGDLPRLQWAQSADWLYLACPSRPLQKLVRASHTAWALAKAELKDGPYLSENTDAAKTLTPAAASGSTTITATGHTPFAATDIGRLIRIKHGATWGYAEVTGFTSSSQVSVTVKSNFGGTSAASAWRLGVYTDVAGPVAVVFHEERLWLAGAAAGRNRLDGSRTGDFENFAPGANDDDPVAITIGADDVASVQWLASWRQMIVGTNGGAFRLGSDQATAAITPTSIVVRRQTRTPAAAARALVTDDSVLFVQQHRRRVRSLVYDLSSDGEKVDDLTLLADDIAQGGAKEMAWANDPDPCLWLATNTGALRCCTYDKGQQVLAWAVATLGGTVSVESIAVIPGTLGDELWLAVTRTIDGAPVRMIEQMQAELSDDGDVADSWYLDSALKYDGSPVSSVSGLDHLNGETVSILADGAVHPPKTVAAGAVALDWPASVVIAGLPYTGTIETMPLETGQDEGTAQSKKRRVVEVMVRFFRSLGGRVGCGLFIDTLPQRAAADPMGTALPLYTGDRKLPVPGAYDEPTVTIEQNLPLPMTVLAVVPRVVGHD